MKLHVKSIMLAVGLLAVAACGKDEEAVKPDQGPSSHLPDWVTKGTGAFSGEKGKVFYGVGSASGIRNAALRRATADNRARSEIAKVFSTFVTRLDKDYMASTTAGDMSASSEEQHVESVGKYFTNMELTGVQIVDHAVDVDGTEYALAMMDLAAFQGQMEKMKELNAKVRDFVRANAEKAFDALEREEQKRAQ